MKAWVVNDDYRDGMAVVFAETRGKAHQMAMKTDACEDSEWNDIRVRRMPCMDSHWEPGKWEMDWYLDEDRIALVKEGWYCIEPQYDKACPTCPAAEWCGPYQDRLEER